ncbi:MAG: hypothetical protein QY318_00770 [Candidatus Dojkabacteria bacterium]|nr:MAG: hypothetical protein QY318_00770 [Candidatus Dojkabacteria bacterium]
MNNFAIDMMQRVRSLKAQKKYEAFSMVEMLLTLLIMGFVMILVGATLTALIKASAISSARTLSRNEKEFMFDLLERYIENADPEEILVYNVSGRYIDEDGSISVSNPQQVAASFEEPVEQASGIGSEIHVRPVGSNNWICIAFYPGDIGATDLGSGFAPDVTTPSNGDESIGYLLKATSDSLANHKDCFDPAENLTLENELVFLNSREIDVEIFEVSYFQSQSENYTFLIDLGIEPVNWVGGESSEFKPLYQDQLVVSTDKIIY